MKLMYCLVLPFASVTEMPAVGMIVTSGPTFKPAWPMISLEKFGFVIAEPLNAAAGWYPGMPLSGTPSGMYIPLDRVLSGLRSNTFIRHTPVRTG